MRYKTRRTIKIGAPVFTIVTLSIFSALLLHAHAQSEPTTPPTATEATSWCREALVQYNDDEYLMLKYAGSDIDLYQQYAESAKERVNCMAEDYNEFMRQYGSVWEGNRPADIKGWLKKYE